QDLGDLMKLAVEERLTASTNAATLVAAGGWCAPSEPLYDLFTVASRDGLLDLPTIGVSRGGVLYPEYMGIDVTDGALWTWCEPTDVAALGSGLAITGAVSDDVATINTATP